DTNNYGFEKIAVFLSWAVVVVLLPFSLLFIISVAYEFERFVIFRLGRVRKRSYGPGIVYNLPCIDEIAAVDIRTDVVNVDPQDLMTKDSVSINVNAVVYYCVVDPIHSIIKVENYRQSTEMIAQVTLRNVVGSKPLHILLTSRQLLSLEIQQAVAEITGKWGILVERVDLMDTKLPSSLERSLASEAEARREARAKIILAEGEAKASQALSDASKVMSQNQITLQLRHLQLLPSMARERRINILFPIPLEMMAPFMDNEQNKKAKSQKDKKKNKHIEFYVPKVIFSGSPPDNFPAEESPSLIQRLALLLNRPHPTRSSRDRKSEEEPYPLPSTPATPKEKLPPIPPPPPRPLLPLIPPHPTMPPLPPVPNRPAPPQRSQSVPKSSNRK
ncbi:hypothetical protein KR026_008536, partial [Drosophila bipectinata]